MAAGSSLGPPRRPTGDTLSDQGVFCVLRILRVDALDEVVPVVFLPNGGHVRRETLIRRAGLPEPLGTFVPDIGEDEVLPGLSVDWDPGPGLLRNDSHHHGEGQ